MKYTHIKNAALGVAIIATVFASIAPAAFAEGKGNEKKDDNGRQIAPKIQNISNKDYKNIFEQFRAWFESRYQSGGDNKGPNDDKNDGRGKLNEKRFGSSTSTPIITGLMATSTRQKGGTVSWTTDKRSTSMIWYSTVNPVNTSNVPNITRSGLVLKHRFNLNGLLPSTTYYVVVGSKDRYGHTVLSPQASFTTRTAPVSTNKPPVITGISGPTTLVASTTGTWTINAYDPEKGTLNYSVNWGDEASKALALNTAELPIVQTTTFTHVYSAPGTYTVTVTVEDDSGHSVSSSITVLVTPVVVVDTTAPIISSITTASASSTATINWLTNEAANSTVYYSTVNPVNASASTTSLVSESNNYVTSHSFTLSGLATSTIYYFLIQSSDTSNNSATSSQGSVTTLAN